MTSELRFICSLLSASKKEQSKYLNMSAFVDLFTVHAVELRWVFDVVEKTGDFPSLETFGAKFQIGVMPVDEKPEIILEPVIEEAMYARMRMITDRSRQLLTQGKSSHEVAKYFKAEAEAMNTLTPSFTEVNWGQASDVYSRYKIRKQNLGKGIDDSITTPWPLLNTYIGFIRPGEVAHFVGRLGMGKSYYALFWALFCAVVLKKKTLVISKEMPKEQIEDRCEMIHFMLNPTRFKNNQLTRAEIMRWKLSRRKFTSGNLVISGEETLKGTTLTDVQAIIRAEKAEVVVIDGLYLMRPEGKMIDRSQRYEEVSRTTKRLAKVENVIIIGVLQLNRESEADRKELNRIIRGTLRSIYGSDAWAQDADFIFSIDGARMLKSFRELNVMKARDAEAEVKIPLKFQFDPHIDLSEASQAYVEEAENKRLGTVPINLDFLKKRLTK